jgi:hypothetical protein
MTGPRFDCLRLRCASLLMAGWLATAVSCSDPGEPSRPEPALPRRGITGLTVSPGRVTLAVGDTFRLRAVATLEYSSRDTGVVWTSSRPAVVPVDSLEGTVRAISPGWATVIATLRTNVNFKAGAEVTVEQR